MTPLPFPLGSSIGVLPATGFFSRRLLLSYWHFEGRHAWSILATECIHLVECVIACLFSRALALPLLASLGLSKARRRR
jgi:hypothetical protein